MRRQHGLPEAVKATGTTKVFNEYLTCLTYSPVSKRIACVGDRGFKVPLHGEHVSSSGDSLAKMALPARVVAHHPTISRD